MDDQRKFAPACDRNREPILAILREILPASGFLLEVGSGTGQHAAYFAPEFADLIWQPTDMTENFASIEAWRAHSAVSNIKPPLELDLMKEEWPVDAADVVVCINTIHIVPWSAVQNLFALARQVLPSGGLFYAYGPYRYATRLLEPSNEKFDLWLKERDPRSGVRDFEAVNALAENNALRLEGDREMPANNRSLWWRKH